MTVEIFGKRKAYKVEDLPGILREVANEIEKEGNPGGPAKYCCEEVERAYELLGRKTKIVAMKLHLKDNLK